MGISTAYLNDPVIAGHLKRKGSTKQLLLFHQAVEKGRGLPAPERRSLDVADVLQKLAERHYGWFLAKR